MKTFKTTNNGTIRNIGISLCAVGLLSLPSVAKAATVAVKNCDFQAPIVVSAIALDGFGGTKGERYYSEPIKLGESYNLDVPTITNGSLRVEASGYTPILVTIRGGRDAHVYAVWNDGGNANTRRSELSPTPPQHSWEWSPVVVTNRDHDTPITVSVYQVDNAGRKVDPDDFFGYPCQVVYSPELKKDESCNLQVPMKPQSGPKYGPQVRVEAKDFTPITVALKGTLYVSAECSNEKWILNYTGADPFIHPQVKVTIHNDFPHAVSIHAFEVNGHGDSCGPEGSSWVVLGGGTASAVVLMDGDPNTWLRIETPNQPRIEHLSGASYSPFKDRAFRICNEPSFGLDWSFKPARSSSVTSGKNSALSEDAKAKREQRKEVREHAHQVARR